MYTYKFSNSYSLSFFFSLISNKHHKAHNVLANLVFYVTTSKGTLERLLSNL